MSRCQHSLANTEKSAPLKSSAIQRQQSLCSRRLSSCAVPGTTTVHWPRPFTKFAHWHRRCSAQHCQYRFRTCAASQDSSMPESTSSDHLQDSTSAYTDPPQSTGWRSLVGRLKIFYDNHWKQAVQDVMGIPVKLHSPTFSQLAWRAAIVFMVTVVLMGVVCTMDKGFAAATAYCIQQVRTVNAGIAAAVAHCTQQRDKYVAVAVAYCMEKVHRKGFAAALFLYGPGVLLS